jgi:GT2 family glycosyltransferase/glycosyltransferase involved in cell wall biosynthesis
MHHSYKTLARRMTAAFLRNHFVSTATIAVLALPISFFYYGGLRGWWQGAIGGESFFSPILNNSIRTYESIKNFPKILRHIVFFPYAISLKIYQDGGLVVTATNFYHVLSRQGVIAFTALIRDLQFNALTHVSNAQPKSSSILVVTDSNTVNFSNHIIHSIVHDLCYFGFDVVCLPFNDYFTTAQEELLFSFGASVITRSLAYDSPQYYIARQGHAFAIYYFFNMYPDEDSIALIRKVSPQAKIILHTKDMRISSQQEYDHAQNLALPDNYSSEKSWLENIKGLAEVLFSSTPIKHQYIIDSSTLDIVDNIIVGNQRDYDKLINLSRERPVTIINGSYVAQLGEAFLPEVGNIVSRSSLLATLQESGVLSMELFIEYCKSITHASPPNLPQWDSIDVTVIIPAYNHWDYTRLCINSILETTRTSKLHFEIILADDCSTDETRSAAQAYPFLHIVKTTTNSGFLRNCNNAAKFARGKYLLLLNNDTVVSPGWMDMLFKVMEEEKTAAIVGSKLLYPDRTIQEAGGILWSDGTASNCGRGHDKSFLGFDYLREVDYVTGASIMIRKSFWDAVGGFDERYENAYCEDSDLAMAARAKGYRVLYQPKSEVVHFESVSYSEGRVNHLHPAQLKNIQRLREKWKKQLNTYHCPPETPEHIGLLHAQRHVSVNALLRRENGQLNILYFSPFPSHPNSHGNQSTIQEFGRRFQAMGHKVHFALLRSNNYTLSHQRAMRECWDTLDILPNNHPLSATGDAIPYDGWYELGLGETVRYLCAKYDIDMVFCSYVFQSKLLEFVPPRILKVIDTHDKMGNRYDMLRANGQPLEFFSCTPEEEGSYLRRADVVVARRQEEADYFDSVTGLASAIVIPHIEPPRFIEKRFNQVKVVGLVASANRINLVIMRDFLMAINRHLQGHACPFEIHVAGQVKEILTDLPSEEAEVFYAPWVKMLGFVPDIAKFYDAVDLVISPVTMGTGINVKTVQAMAFGMPLLSTAWGVKGIETGDMMHSYHDLDSLVNSLFLVCQYPDEIERLAKLSRNRYNSFYEQSMEGMRLLFAHPKLRPDPE